MIKKGLLALLSIFLIYSSAMSQTPSARIIHSVVFKLKHPAGSAEEKSFLEAIVRLADIPGVENLKLMKEISKKNHFDYGLSMEFASQEAYDAYNNHPNHTAFVQNRWLKEVEDFMEIDYDMDSVKKKD